MQISGAARREITKSYFGFDVIARSEATKQSILSLRGKMDCFASLAMTVSNAPHSQPSSPAKAGDPVFRGVSDGAEKLRRTGYSAFAEYDGGCEERCDAQFRLRHSPMRNCASGNLEIPGSMLRIAPE
jgi:hypothetical protein